VSDSGSWGGGNRGIKRYETSISYFMSNITIEIYTMFLFIHVVQQMWTVPVVQSTKIHSTIGYCRNIGESGVKHHPPSCT
jgi:hypothetical protein